MTQTPDLDDVKTQATIKLAEYLSGQPPDGSKWLTVDEGHLMRVDTFANTVRANVFGKDTYGVVQLGNPIIIISPNEKEPQPLGEIDQNRVDARFDELLTWDDVRLRGEAWLYMRSGETLTGMSNEDIAEYILGWELQKYPRRFMG